MAAPDFDTRQLLLSNRLDRLTLDPFCFFCVDNYLPSHFYETLLETYPAGAEYTPNPEGKLGFRSSIDTLAMERFCDLHPAWASLFEFFRSDVFLEDARRVLDEPLRRARPGWPGRRSWYNGNVRGVPRNLLRYQLQEPVTTTFQFSELSRDAVVAPHSDAPRKLFTMLLYFRLPEWQDEWGGATEFYTPLDLARARSWNPTDRISFEEFKPIGTTGYVGNRLAGFVRSPTSYHGVLPVTCPAGMSRKAWMINVKRIKWSKRDRL